MRPNVIPFAPDESDYQVRKAIVKSVTDDKALIELNGVVVTAEIALSCLVAPEPEDQVLIGQSTHECYVLAVLVRCAQPNVVMNFKRDVKICAPHGGMHLISGTDIDLVAAAKTHLFAPQTDLISKRLNVNSQETTMRTRELTTNVKHAKVFAESIDTVAQRITQRVDILMRWVEKIETLNIGSLIQNVRKIFTSHAHHAIITAKKDIKIDGERIHMG